MYKTINKSLVHRLLRGIHFRTVIYPFGKEKQSTKEQEMSQHKSSIAVKDIIDESPAQQLSPSQQPKSTEQFFASKILNKCTPLMQNILKGASLHNFTIQRNKPNQQTSGTYNVHDLNNFRHMLAGPLPSQASLDKFCAKKGCPILLDVKYDGERSLLSYKRGQDLEMISRNGKSQTVTYQLLKQRVSRQLQRTDTESIRVDGEIVLVDSQLNPLPLGELMKMKKLRSEQDGELEELEDWQLQLEGKKFLVYVFDVVEYNGRNLMELPLIERRKFIPKIDIFRQTQYKMVQYPKQRAQIFEFFTSVLQRKYQGLILKGQNDKYYTNQTRTIWKKLKRGFSSHHNDPSIAKVELDLVVMGANRGSGFKNQHIFNSFLMGTPYNGKIVPISNVGSGFNEEILVQIATLIQDQELSTSTIPQEYDMQSIKVDMMYKPKLVFEIHAQEFSISPIYNLGRGQFGGLSLRFPSFKRIRDDKGVKQATKGQQIIELSKSFNLNLPV